MRMISAFYKHNEVRFVSHLDMQRMFQRAFRRAGLPLAYSKGFNPHPLLSFATALSVGYTSDEEYFDIQLENEMSPKAFINSVNAVLPSGVRIIKAMDASGSKTSLTTLMRSAIYDVNMVFNKTLEPFEVDNAINSLLADSIDVVKRTKGGMKTVDIRPMLLGIELKKAMESSVQLCVNGKLTATGGLPLELLLNVLCEKLGSSAEYQINRRKIEMDWNELK